MRGVPRTSGRDFELELLELGQALGRNGLAGDIGDHFRQVPDLAVLVQNARLFLALWPVTQKFHAVPLWWLTDASAVDSLSPEWR